jgi:type IV pilus assembly protein PilY1
MFYMVACSSSLVYAVAPTVTSPIGNETVAEDSGFTNITGVDNNFEDLDGDLLTLSISNSTNPGLFSQLIIQANKNVRFTPAPDQNGTSAVTVRATDPGGDFAETTFVVTVNSVNDPPIYQIGSYVDLDLVEDASPITLNLASVFVDADLLDGDSSDEELTFYITLADVPDEFVLSQMFDTDLFTTSLDASNNVVIETTSPSIILPLMQDAHGYSDVTVRAEDQGRPPTGPAAAIVLFDERTFRVDVSEVGDDLPVAEDDHYSDGEVLEEDDDGNPTLTLAQVLTIEEDSDPVAIPVLANDYRGDVPARVVAAGQIVTIDAQQHFWRTTTRLADPLNSGDTVTVMNGEVMCAQCPLPSPDSTLTGGGLTDDVVLYKPLLDFNGEDTFTYTIRDSAGVEESTATVTVLVEPKNDPPQPEPIITYVMDQATDLVVPVEEGLRTKVIDIDNTHIDGFGCDPSLPSCTPAPTDPQPDTLYFQITQATTEHGSIDAPWCCDGAFTYRPDASFAGEDSFVFDVCDRPDGVATEENCIRDVVVTITINSIAGAPVGSSDETVEFDYQLAQRPLELPIGPEPNVLVIMDDSGSMHWDILTDQNSGVYYYSTGNYVYYVSPATSGGSVYGSTNVAPSEEAAPNQGVWRLRNSTYNAVYYNPAIRYDPWKGLDANDNEFQDSPPTAARHNPLNAAPVTNLTLPITYTGRAPVTQENCGNVCVQRECTRWRRGRCRRWGACQVYEYRCTTSSGFQNVVSNNFYVPRHYKWTDNDGDTKLDSTPSPFLDPGNSEGELVEIKPAAAGGSDTYPKGTDRTDCETVADSCTYAEELQNFANWFTYSRNRELTAKTSLGQVVAEAENLRVGYAVLNRSTRRKPITSMNTSDRTGAKAALLDEIYQTVPSGGTPLRRALNKAGLYYECKSGNSMGTGNSSPGDAACPVLAAPEGNCQQNFALLFTDGTWNGSSPGLGNKDGDNLSNFDGGVYAHSYATSLADVAMHYYERDLHTLNNEVPTTGRDQAGAAVDAFENSSNEVMHQHMSTYTVGFGVIGLVDPDDIPTDYTQSFNWGSPTTSPRKTDDVLHAAVNGRGEYLSASNTKQLADALTSAFEEFAQGSGAASAVSFNSQEVQEDTLIFRAFYNTKINTGDLVAQKLTADELIEEPVWSSAEALDLQTFDTREILTYDPDTGLGIPFRPTSLNADQRDFFIYDPSGTLTQAEKDAQVVDKINYLRGDNSNERPTGSLRERPSVKGRLGDIVHSTPVFVGKPNRLNREAEPYPQSELYSTFQENSFNRAPMIYVTANDGMLHGFSSVDGTEVFGYVPNNLMLSEYSRDITELLNYEYSHKYFVDLTPAINDVYIDLDDNGSKEWASVVIGGHGAGAKAYFALNVTDPALLDESTAASVVLWEFTSDDDTYPTDATGNPLLTASSGQRQDSLTPAQPVKDLGYGFSVPTLAMSNVVDTDGEQEWVVIFGNGYNSTAGIAKLFVLFADKGTDGTWCHPDMVYNTSLTPTALPSECVGKQDFVKIDTGFGVPDSGPLLGFPNGLGTPRAIDVDANGTVDYAYAGDVLGNFFRFDLTSSNFNNWTFTKIFEATYDNNGTTEIQAITTQPIVVNHPSQTDGFIVIFATGSYITIPDGSDNKIQSIYGLWDRLGPGLITRSDLGDQFYTNVNDPTFGNVRLLSNNEVDYSAAGGKKGWFNDLNPVPEGGTPGVDNAEFPGERAIRNLQLKGGLIFVNSVIPRSDASCIDVAGGFALSFCPENGGLACLDDKGIFDLDNDGEFDSNDDVNNRVVAGIRFEDAVPTDSSFIGDERITQLSDKSIDRVKTNTTGGLNTGRLSWKQLDSIQ